MRLVSTAENPTNAVDWDAYDRDGVLALPGFFGKRDAVQLEDGWRDVVEASQALGIKRSDRFVMGVLPGFVGSLCRHPSLRALARHYCGPDIALYMNRILLKDRGWSGAV